MLLSWLLSGFLLIFIMSYLIAVTLVVGKIKKNEIEYWDQIKNPSMGDPSGQSTIVWKVIMGADLPHSIAVSYRKGLVTVRTLLFLSVLTFVFTAVLIVSGQLG